MNRSPEDVATSDADWLHESVHGNYAEKAPSDSAGPAKIWAYTDKISYSPGDNIRIAVNTNVEHYSIEVFRDGILRHIVYEASGLPGRWSPTPDDCSASGCQWPVSVTVAVANGWSSGGYVVRVSAMRAEEIAAYEHLFILRPDKSTHDPTRLLLIAATNTWTAYNDWGGSNHYQGYCGPNRDCFSPRLSVLRPYARGFVSLPEDAPRAVLTDTPAPMTEPRYPHMEWAYTHGYSKKYVSAGWASFERHFVLWAEAEGYGIDVISQTDLHLDADVLANHRCVIMVGHDEYWSWEMRDAIDRFVSDGGKVARFAGNFMWQIRLESSGATQVCYKYTAVDEDPLMQSGPRHLVTEAWEAKEINRPGSATFGLNATQGMYASWSGCSPRGAKGFPVYRPEHWAFADTGLYYGDILGRDSAIFGYEVDGIGYEIRGGLPFVMPADTIPDGLEILALGLSSTIEEGPTIIPGRSFLGREDAAYIAAILAGNSDDESIEKTKRGCGAIVTFTRGKGEVFHAGSSDWIMGLSRNDPMVIKVTNNVLRRFLSA
ncbi:N,N-dimethylformamidase beta subunit family domain-containing protein [Acidisoma cladoniae]|jgi:hypothetical protein|uniref:N,N-dimethylformamidase beta subunit family domain-containing protein n=1 Tax=Acidisoma cladoniae TaxID=3040935 RepID=UPI00254F7D89|nr:N,N-dimethylformamidase beta subunit family domain-containing protein [Acidisoma sp. PAMC 29798]